MAQDIVSSLFGLSPWEVQQQRNTAIDQAAQTYAKQDPFQRATATMYQAGAGLGRIGAGMLGMQDPAVAEAEQRQAIMSTGGDLTTAEGLRAKAAQFAQAGDQKTAMRLSIAAKEAEADQQKMLIERQKQALGERKQEFQETELLKMKQEQLQAQIDKNNAVVQNSQASLEERKRANQANESLRAQGLQIQAMIAQMRGEAASSGNKPPAGYRWTKDGNLELIPGGPADLKATAAQEQRAVGTSGLNSTIASLRDAYDRLETGGGITDINASTISNIGASTASSNVGQLFGRMVGTKNQSARNEIEMTRPALLAALMKATGMSAKQIDSNAELKLWLQTATDPKLDIQSNRAALKSIEDRYLSGGDTAPPNAPKLSAEDAQALAWVKANPNDPRAAKIKAKLGVK